METLAETRPIAGRNALSRLLRTCTNAVLIAVIDTYRYLLSPLLGMHCRFDPTCSLYARQSIEQHGPWRGSALAVGRLLKCHPWHEGGIDPVPHAAHPQTERVTNQMDKSV